MFVVLQRELGLDNKFPTIKWFFHILFALYYGIYQVFAAILPLFMS